jgi:NADH pyrophosphatase NudC (nudix superfamily)
MNKKINGDFNRVQINYSIDKNPDGSIMKKSLLINIRENEIEKACEMYRELLSKIGESAEGSGSIANQVEAQINSTPQCPLCGAKMTLRVNGKKGNQFWGCSTFPRCKGVRQFEQVLSSEQLIPVE